MSLSSRISNCLIAAFWAASCIPLSSVAAELNDVTAVPHIDSAGQEGYRDFLMFDQHRAYAIAPGGVWSWKGGEPSVESAERGALNACRDESGVSCVLYAVDDKVVFDARAWARLWGPYLSRAEADRAPAGLNRGERFPNLLFKSGDGKSVTLADLRGKAVVLHFWGSWCSPCRSEMPELQKLYRGLGASPDVRMVLLQLRESADVSRRWMQQQRLSLPMYDSGVNGKSMDTLTLADGRNMRDREIAAVFPTTYILDKHGIVVFSNIGPVSRWPQYLPLLKDVAARSGK
jgi:thiol-disulfide isomerase/thioredoxin